MGSSGDGLLALTGAGGDGGDGGDGSFGGDMNDAFLILIDDVTVDLINNMLASPSAWEIGGNAGEPGIGGLGGSGDLAGSDGEDGGNYADGFPGTAIGVWSIGSIVLMTNTIIYGTWDANQTGIYLADTSTLVSDYNVLYRFDFPYFPTSIEGDHDNFADPLFVNDSLHDFHLLSGSPCIDAGDDSAAGLPDVDFDLLPRPLDGDLDGVSVIDVGAYEFEPIDLFLPLILR